MSAQVQKEKAEKLNNSIIFDVHKFSEFKEVNQATDHLYGLINAELDGSVSIAKRHIKTVVINLYNAYLKDPELYIAYSRNNNDYLRKKSRYNKLHISRKTVLIVDVLNEFGFIEHHIGFYSKQKSKLSRMRAAPKLIDLIFNEYSFKYEMIQRPENTEVIILRDKDKNDIEYTDNPPTEKMRADLNQYNTLLMNADIVIPSVAYPDPFTRRVFNDGNFLHGGRYYGGEWQRINSDERAQIKLNGSPVVELDYSGLHIVLLYAVKGIDYWEQIKTDPYALPSHEEDKQLRSFFKLVTLIAINAKDEASAIKAIRNKINYNPNDWGWVRELGLDIQQLVNQFKELHPSIAGTGIGKYGEQQGGLFSGIGTMLQGVDALIVEQIINQFTKDGIAILSVHDSFLVEEQYEDLLRDRMINSFSDTLKEIGVDKDITIIIK